MDVPMVASKAEGWAKGTAALTVGEKADRKDEKTAAQKVVRRAVQTVAKMV